ncbi:MAG: HIT family protein [Lachnospiraceae bacterium]|nr:HIT family protein [Lachnospiraceae bacterium]MBP5600894.1 HIT family protein [Lachnospiraceae bacterium]
MSNLPEFDSNCAYCAEGELLDAFGIKIGELPMSKVILFKEQSHKGRIIVACKRHVDDISDLTVEERHQFMDDVSHVAEIIKELFKPDKVNFGAYGDTMHHLHFHLVPKYKDGFEWGGVFQMNPGAVKLTEEEYKELVEMVKAKL